MKLEEPKRPIKELENLMNIFL